MLCPLLQIRVACLGRNAIALSGFNLLHAHLQEFTVLPSVDFGRGAVLVARWRIQA